MRRLIILVSALVILLAAASPVAAARPFRDSGTFEQASAFVASCEQQGGNTLCTETYVDVFTFEGEFADACVGVFTYRLGRNGQFRLVSDQSGCAPVTAFSMASDLSGASLAPTEIHLFSCGPRTCTEGDVVTVSAEWEAFGDPVTYSRRETFNDGACRYRQSVSGTQTQAASDISLDGMSFAADGFLMREEYTVTQQCR